MYIYEYERFMLDYLRWYGRSRLPLDERERHVSFYLLGLHNAFTRLNRNSGMIQLVEQYREARQQLIGTGCYISTQRINEPTRPTMVPIPVQLEARM